jgi:hypothetical protein
MQATVEDHIDIDAPTPRAWDKDKERKTVSPASSNEFMYGVPIPDM